MVKKILLSFLILFSIFSNSYGQKKTAALAPMGSLGQLNEVEKRVIFNSLQESLSKYFVLASQKMYEKAEEEAFQEMDADECTESQCIAIIQELLQTEFFFMFEIVKAGSFQQMKITRVDLDGNRDVRTETCDNCSISQVNGKVDILVQKLNNNNDNLIVNQKKNNENKISFMEANDNTLSFIFSLNTPLSIGEWDFGGAHIPFKKSDGISIGIKYENNFFKLRILNIEFGDNIDTSHSSYGTEKANYKLNTSFISYFYEIDNFLMGYNHLINGTVSEDIIYTVTYSPSVREYISLKETSKLNGYGLSLGYKSKFEKFLFYILLERFSFNAESIYRFDPGMINYSGISLGGGFDL